MRVAFLAVRFDLSVSVVDADPTSTALLRAAIRGVGLSEVVDGADAAIVPCHLAPAAPLTDLGGEGWIGSVEEPLRRTLRGLLEGRRRLTDQGSVVVVVPTIGIAGAAGLIGLTTVVEGVRSMAKSAARQWAAEGVSVNMLALPLSLLDHDLGAHTGHLQPMAGRLPTTDDVGAALLPLLQASEAMVGATVVLDGGSVMAP